MTSFVLLALRLAVSESQMFENLKLLPVVRGDILLLVKDPRRIWKLVRCILVGLPVYFVVGLLITGAPEFGHALGINGVASAAIAVMLAYIGMSVGDVVCGLISQILESRLKALLIFGVLSGVTIATFLFYPDKSLVGFYIRCTFVGFGVGFWALINTVTAEQFGTNLRATATTLSPNLIRASLIPIAMLFNFTKGGLGMSTSAVFVGALVIIVSLASTLSLPETFGVDISYNEE